MVWSYYSLINLFMKLNEGFGYAHKVEIRIILAGLWRSCFAFLLEHVFFFYSFVLFFENKSINET